MIRAGDVAHQRGIDIGKDEAVGADDDMGPDIEGNVDAAAIIGKCHAGIQELGGKAGPEGIGKQRGRQMLMQQEEADERIQLGITGGAARHRGRLTAVEGLRKLRTQMPS